jgi:hypothetical protein
VEDKLEEVAPGSKLPENKLSAEEEKLLQDDMSEWLN